jgi:hypothetical protein
MMPIDMYNDMDVAASDTPVQRAQRVRQRTLEENTAKRQGPDHYRKFLARRKRKDDLEAQAKRVDAEAERRLKDQAEEAKVQRAMDAKLKDHVT